MTARGRGDPVSPGKPMQASRKVPACPMCGKPVALESRPFCSRRCADIDLGRWLGGRYAVPGEPVEHGSVQESDEDDRPLSARRTRQGGDDFL